MAYQAMNASFVIAALLNSHRHSHARTSTARRFSFLCRSSIAAMLDVWRLNFQVPVHRVLKPVSIWPSVLRQPAHRLAVPKCHALSPSWPPVLRRSASPMCSFQIHEHQAQSLEIKTREPSHAKAKRPFSESGLCVLNALSCAPQPNCRFNADKNTPHFCRLTLALDSSLQTQNE